MIMWTVFVDKNHAAGWSVNLIVEEPYVVPAS